jgi:membrane-bound lytic murein transglycosylase B
MTIVRKGLFGISTLSAALAAALLQAQTVAPAEPAATVATNAPEEQAAPEAVDDTAAFQAWLVEFRAEALTRGPSQPTSARRWKHDGVRGVFSLRRTDGSSTTPPAFPRPRTRSSAKS